eukprot:3645386-Rhodomonas_salina.1
MNKRSLDAGLNKALQRPDCNSDFVIYVSLPLLLFSPYFSSAVFFVLLFFFLGHLWPCLEWVRALSRVIVQCAALSGLASHMSAAMSVMISTARARGQGQGPRLEQRSGSRSGSGSGSG